MHFGKIIFVLSFLIPVFTYSTDTGKPEPDAMEIDTEEVVSGIEGLSIEDVVGLIEAFEENLNVETTTALLNAYIKSNNTIVKTYVKRALNKKGIRTPDQKLTSARRLFQ